MTFPTRTTDPRASASALPICDSRWSASVSAMICVFPVSGANVPSAASSTFFFS
jgi:hypothetical protein